MTSNVSNTTVFCDTLSIPYINSTSLKASYLNVDLLIGTNISAVNFYGNGSSLSSINSANISQPFSNLVVSNSLTTTNVFASGNISSTSLTVTEYVQIQFPGSGWKSIAFGDGVFVAVSYEKVAYSTDLGRTWNTSTLPGTGQPWNFVFYTNSGIFLTLGDSTEIAVSRDYGKTWSPLETDISVNQNWTSGCFTSYGSYVMIGGSEHWSGYTDDLDSPWDTKDLIVSTTWTSVSAGNNGVCIAVGSGDAGAVSVNGFTWTLLDLTYDINWKSVCFGNGFFVVVGYGTTSIRTSDDGVNFYSSSLPVEQSWNSVCFGNGNFVTVGDSSTGAWSDDNASTWHTSTLPHNVPWSSVNYGDGCFVAISVDGFVAISTDKGKTWIMAGGSTVDFGFYSDPSSLGAKSFLITTNNLNTSAPALSLSTNGSGWVGVAGVVYPTCALDVGSGNVSALKFIGDGSLLTNLPNSFIQPLANLAVSNSLSTTNVFASGNVSALKFIGDGSLLTNLPVSNSLTTTNVFASGSVLAARFYGNGSGLSGIQSANISQPFANLSVSNSLTTTNVFASGSVVIGRNITALQANVHVEQSNVFIGNSACIGTVSSTINPVNSLYFDNFTTSGNSTFPNKIVLFNQTGMGFCGFGVQGTTPSTVYHGRGGHVFFQGSPANQIVVLSGGGMAVSVPLTVGTSTFGSYGLQIAARGSTGLFSYSSNVALRIESSNICMTTGPSYAGFGTTAPTANLHVVGTVYATSNLSIGGSATIASDTFTSPFGTFGTLGILSGVTVGPSSTVLGSNLAVFSGVSGGSNVLVFNSSAQLGLGTPNPTSTLHVIGNVFASNAISTINIFANTLTLSNTTSRITVTGNIYASNAISTTNLIASNTLTVGTATLGSNVAIFSNISGGSNVVVISSNSYVGIGLTNPSFQLDLSTDNARKLSSTTWATGSDIRVKTDIESANLFTCYNNVKNLELKYFKWNYPDVEVSDSHMLGYIAQEVAEYFPNSVKVTDSHGFPDFLSLDTDQILKSMYGALQKTIEDKEALEEKLELAQNDIDLLETRLSDLEALVRTLLPSKEDQVSSGPRSAALMNQM
jgi:hypothetical protein